MGANFTPDWNGYTSMKPFKFWCQKVLPTVYDDSLSYYEVLCKLVKYLNQVIENMEKVEENTDALLVAYNELQNWVNDYFDNLDVQDEIDHKIDEMVEDGTFDRWIEPIIESYEGDLQALLDRYAGDAQEYVKSAEAWAKGTKNGEPVTSDDPQYHDNSKYWAQQSDESAEDAEAWAKGTKGGTPVGSGEPQYHDNAKYWAEQAQQSAGGAGGYDEDAEAWAVGTKGGTPVASDEPQYENNSKYWAGQAEAAAQSIPQDAITELDFARRCNFAGTAKLTVVDTYTTYGGITINQAGLVVMKLPLEAWQADEILGSGHYIGDWWAQGNGFGYVPYKALNFGGYTDGQGTLDGRPDIIVCPYPRVDNYMEGGVLKGIVLYAVLYDLATGQYVANGETVHLSIMTTPYSISNSSYAPIIVDVTGTLPTPPTP